MTSRLLMVFFAAAAAIPAQVAQTGSTDPAASKPKARLEGRVLNATTGEALKKATLRLRMVGTVGVANGPSDNSTTVSTTEADGKFVFDEVPPGRYILTSERSGFVNQNYSAQSGRGAGPLVLDSGTQMKDVVIKMIPQATISGRVLDEDGDPITRVQIQVLQYRYNQGRRQLFPANGASTNPDGTFMIGGLAAGKYYLAASEMRPMMMQDRVANRRPVEAYVQTYFPNAVDPTAATPIQVMSGQDSRGIDIRLRKQRVYAIRGKIAANTVAKNIMLMLFPKTPEAMFMMNRSNAMTREKDGSFEFNFVSPGTYVIQTQNIRVNGENSTPLAAHYEITVGDQDVEDVVVPLTPPGEINGTVKIEGSDLSAGVQQSQQRSAAAGTAGAPGGTGAATRPPASIQLVQVQGINFNGTPNARAADDGTFQIKNVAPEKYRVNVQNSLDGTYVKSIRFGSQDVTRTELDLTSDSNGTLEVVLSPNAADVSGVVRDSTGGAANGITVNLWNASNPFDQPKTFNAGQNGTFKFLNLAPGDYKVIAWEDIEPGLIQNVDFRKQFESQAASVSLKESSHESVELKIIPKDTIDAEAAKVK